MEQEHNLKLLMQATRSEAKDAFMQGNMSDARELNDLANQLEEDVKKLALERVRGWGRAA